MNVRRDPLPKVGVAAVLWNRHDEVLLIKRGKEPAKTLWSIPGGTLEPGETITQGCRREVMEETGLDVKIGPVIAVVERISFGFHYVIIDFLATLIHASAEQHPVAASDVDDARWVAPKEFKDYPLVEGLMDIIMAARNASPDDSDHGLYDRQGNGSDFISLKSL